MSAHLPAPTYSPDLDLLSVAGVPVIYHCHHFNLFLDQTIDDALGPELGPRVRFEAAREAFYELLSAVITHQGADSPAERVLIATELFARMGHGRLDLDAGPTGGAARGGHLHYGFAWREKYGGRVGRDQPADAVAAGFAAAATEIAFGLPRESARVEETACVAAKAPECTFSVALGAQSELRARCRIPEYQRASSAPQAGLHEARIQEITTGLQGFLAGVGGDERGLVQAFGVFVTMHLPGYYNRISYDALHSVLEHRPRALRMIEVLLRESGHVCVFNTFGGILMSPEWEALVGPPRTPEDVIVGCVAIGRALGFGHWTIHEHAPEARLILRTTSSYEAGYYVTRHGKSERPNDYFFQGATMAIAQLAHRVDWAAKQPLTQSFYESLFKGPQPWALEPRQACLACGDGYSEVAVRQG